MNLPVSRPEAAKELLRRRSIRRSLTEYARFKGFEPAAHHQLIIDEIEAFLADPSLDVLMLHAPPGSAKSTYLSVLLPPYYLARFPANNILAATHNQEFAQRWGRKVRNDLLRDSSVLGIAVAQDNSAADRWALTTGGEYYGVGAGVGISGFRADLGMCDDLFGSREDAYSETIREKRWDWYRDDFCGRLKPGAKRILMNTRWHEEDVAGREIQRIQAGIVRGRIIDLPAKADQNDVLGRSAGEYLWDDPTGYNYGAFLRAREREVSPMMWSALYQQRPAPEEGDYFKTEWLRPYDKAPARDTLRIYGGSDYAVTADGGDYTVHAVVGVDPQGRMYLLDLWRKQAASDEWIESFCDLVREWKPTEWAEEQGQIRAGVGPFLDRRMRERTAYVYRRQFPTRGDKAVRAQSIRGRMALDGLYVPHTAGWYADFRSELLSFPAGKHDDQVDAMGLVGQLLDTIMTGNALPGPQAPKKPDDYRAFQTVPSDNDSMMIA
jgi:predicted phage terminase large subunit-like protein